MSLLITNLNEPSEVDRSFNILSRLREDVPPVEAPEVDDADSTEGADLTFDEWRAFFDALWPRLGDNAKALLKAMAHYDHGVHWSSHELATKLGITPAQLKGRRANLGRSTRVAAEDVGINDGVELTSWEWDSAIGQYRYWLPEPARQAVLAK
jgi:hypothetical protein